MYCCGNCDLCNVEKEVIFKTDNSFSTFAEPIVEEGASSTDLAIFNSNEIATNNPEYELKKNIFGQLVAKRVKE